MHRRDWGTPRPCSELRRNWQRRCSTRGRRWQRAQVGADSEKCRFEHKAQTWATALHGKWMRQAVAVAIAKHTWQGVREVVANAESQGGGGLCQAGVEQATRQGGSRGWGGVSRSPARCVAGFEEGWGSRGDPMTEHNKENGNGMASNCGAAGVGGGWRSGEAILDKLGEQAEAGQRRVGSAVRGAGEQRGVRVVLTTQRVGSIAEHDPGVHSFRRT